MMCWKFLTLVAVLLALSACAAPVEQSFSDNGDPGSIKVVTFYDQNANGFFDQGESGVSDRVSISQEISCPAADPARITSRETSPSGTATFDELKPGEWCVAYMGSRGMTNKMTQKIFVNSDLVTNVYFALSEK